MPQLTDPKLRRFWFPIPDRLGIGVTARSRAEANTLAREAATRLGLPVLDTTNALEDIDIRDLDQRHVVPNMGPPNLRGVWFPRL